MKKGGKASKVKNLAILKLDDKTPVGPYFKARETCFLHIVRKMISRLPLEITKHIFF